MSDKKMRVKARGTAMVCDYNALEAGGRRFIGRAYDPNMGTSGGWPTTGVQEVPYRIEYADAIRNGDLEAADAETAAIAGVVFNEVA